MSGPKVVRIVTREERLAECTAALAKLDRAIGAFAAQGAPVDNKAATTTMHARREALAAELGSERLDGVVQRLSAETAFVLDATENLRLSAALAKATALQLARRQRTNAETLLRDLTAKKPAPDSMLFRALSKVRDGQMTGEDAEWTVRAGFQELAAPNTEEPALSKAQNDLARRLQSQESTDYEAWRARADLSDSRLHRIEQRIAELSSYLGDAVTRSFLERLYALTTAPPDSRGNLLIDSLIADVQSALDQAREIAAETIAAEDLVVQIESDGDTRQDAVLPGYASALRAAIATNDAARLRDALPAAEEAWRRHLARKAMKARRAAVLGGLAVLGYEVHEGMNTALASQGRVVLKKPTLAGFGVEIAGGGEVTRMQVRTVAFDEVRDNRRDGDAETLWCADFHKLKELLEERGNEVSIEKSLAIGVLPLKTVKHEAPQVAVPAVQKGS